MKEMVYSSESKIEVLETGYCLGLLFFIMNLGTYPTAYFKVPENSIFYKKRWDEIDIDVHGGITYAKESLWISETQKVDGYFIGWDYAHFGDYAGYEEMLPINLRTNGKKWTTEEIFKEVKEVCYQIQENEEK